MRKAFMPGFSVVGRMRTDGQGPKLVLGRNHLRAHTAANTAALSDLTGPPKPLRGPIIPSSRAEFRTLGEVVDGLGLDLSSQRAITEKLRSWSQADNPVEFRRSLYGGLRAFAPDNFPLRSELGRRCMSYFRATAGDRFSRAWGREGQRLVVQKAFGASAPAAPQQLSGGASPESQHRGANIGEVRDWKGGKFRKVGPGQWEPVSGPPGVGKQPAGKPSPGAPGAEEAPDAGSSDYHTAQQQHHIREALGAAAEAAEAAPEVAAEPSAEQLEGMNLEDIMAHVLKQHGEEAVAAAAQKAVKGVAGKLDKTLQGAAAKAAEHPDIAAAGEKAAKGLDENSSKEAIQAATKQASEDPKLQAVAKAELSKMEGEVADQVADGIAEAAPEKKPSKFRAVMRAILKGGAGSFVFGFLDNFVMYCAGASIDKHIIAMGAGAAAVAGIGNAISDGVGQAASNLVDKGLDKIGLGEEETQGVLSEKAEKRIKGISSVAGVFVGALTGMVPLLFGVSFGKSERRARGRRLLIKAKKSGPGQLGLFDQPAKPKPPATKTRGLFIGPRGGKWADPQHTIPYQEPKPARVRAKPKEKVKVPEPKVEKLKTEFEGLRTYVTADGKGPSKEDLEQQLTAIFEKQKQSTIFSFKVEHVERKSASVENKGTEDERHVPAHDRWKVTVEHEAAIPGHTLSGKIDITTGVVTLFAHDSKISRKDYDRAEHGHCDVCKTKRVRHSVFVVNRDKDNKNLLVGGECAKKFNGANLIKLSQQLNDVDFAGAINDAFDEREERGGYGGGGFTAAEPHEILGAALWLTRKHGYEKRTDSSQGTAGHAEGIVGRYKGVEVSDEDRAEIKKTSEEIKRDLPQILAWVQESIPAGSEAELGRESAFMLSVQKLLSSNFVKMRDVSRIAWVPYRYYKVKVQREQKEKAKAYEAPHAKMHDLPGAWTVTSKNLKESDYGSYWSITAMDVEGHKIWFRNTSAVGNDLQEGDELKLRGKLKQQKDNITFMSHMKIKNVSQEAREAEEEDSRKAHAVERQRLIDSDNPKDTVQIDIGELWQDGPEKQEAFRKKQITAIHMLMEQGEDIPEQILETTGFHLNLGSKDVDKAQAMFAYRDLMRNDSPMAQRTADLLKLYPSAEKVIRAKLGKERAEFLLKPKPKAEPGALTPRMARALEMAQQSSVIQRRDKGVGASTIHGLMERGLLERAPEHDGKTFGERAYRITAAGRARFASKQPAEQPVKKSENWDAQLAALRPQMRLTLDPQPMSLIWVAEAGDQLHERTPERMAPGWPDETLLVKGGEIYAAMMRWKGEQLSKQVGEENLDPLTSRDLEVLIKAKYVKREGMPGNYVYTYPKTGGGEVRVRQKHIVPGSRGPYKKTRDKQGNTVYTGGDKPPGKGWTSVTESKQGGMRRRGARTEEHGRWEYWYPAGAKQTGIFEGKTPTSGAEHPFSEYTEGRLIPVEMYDGLATTKGGKLKVTEHPDGTFTVKHRMKGVSADTPVATKADAKLARNMAERFYGRLLNNEEADLLKQHRKVVKNAIKAGKAVPEKVLKDYPDLKPRSAAAQSPDHREGEESSQAEPRGKQLGLFKAADHKYIKRVPTGKAKPRYRYFYQAAKTKGITESRDVQLGAKFKIEHGGQLGHFEIRGHDADSGIVTVRHDESGRTVNLQEKDLHRMISGHHGRKTKRTVEERAERHREKREAQALKLRVQPTQPRLLGTEKPMVEPKKPEPPAPKLPRASLNDLGKGGFDDIAGFSMDAAELERQAAIMRAPDREFAVIPQAQGFVLASKAKTVSKGPAAVGESTDIYLRGAGRSIQSMKAEWAVVEADTLIASHDSASFAPRTDYPAKVQERPYHRDKSEQIKVDAIARDLLPAMVANSNPDAINGAPIVTESGVVLGGNGRTMGMQRAYQRYPESAKGLREHLQRHARAFGVSSAEVGAMKNPVLVRRVKAESPDEMTRLGRRMNEALTQGLDPRAAEVAVSKFVTQDVVDDLTHRMAPDQTLSNFLSRPASKEFIQTIKRAGIIDERNENQFVNAETGLLNEDGRERIARVMAARLIPDSDLLDSMNQSWRENLAQAVPSFLQAETAGWDLRPHLVAAVQSDADMQAKGFKRTDKGRKLYLAQIGLLDKGKHTSEARALLQILHEHGDKKVGLPRGFKQVALEADRQKHDHGDQASMFARPKVSAVESLAASFKLKGEELAASMSVRAALGAFLGDSRLQKAEPEPEGLGRYLMHAVLWELDNLMRGELQAVAGGAARIDGPRMLKRLKRFIRDQAKADPGFARALGAHPLDDATLRGLCQAAAKSRVTDIVKALSRSALEDGLAKSREIQYVVA